MSYWICWHPEDTMLQMPEYLKNQMAEEAKFRVECVKRTKTGFEAMIVSEDDLEEMGFYEHFHSSRYLDEESPCLALCYYNRFWSEGLNCIPRYSDEKRQDPRMWYAAAVKAGEIPEMSDVSDFSVHFDFSLPDDLCMDEPDEMFELAEYLQKNNYVSMRTHDGCTIDYVIDEPYDRKNVSTYVVKDLNNIENHALFVAGYVDYLVRSGQYEEYKKRRRAVTANDPLSGIKNKGLYCVIEGEAEDTINRIQKILGTEARRITFEHLANMLCYNTKDEQGILYTNLEPIPKNTLFVLDGLEVFVYYARQHAVGSAFSHLCEALGHYDKNTYIVVLGEQPYTDEFLSLSPEIRFLFGNNIFHKELSDNEMWSIYSSLGGCASKDRFFSHINKSPLKSRELAEYLAVNGLPEDLIGLKDVKQKLAELKRYAMLKKRADENGLELPSWNMNMVFMGNPGTGKTTVAHIVAEILYETGLVKTNKLIEAGPSNFCPDGAGSVLFIDEAYLIDPTALAKAMDDFVVIFSGYEKEMSDFISSNPDLFSRAGYTFRFDDYSTDELLEMYDRKIKKAGFTYSESVLAKARNIFDALKGKHDNGRLVDKMVQGTIANRAQRDGDLSVLAEEDVPKIEEPIPEDKLGQVIGMEEIKKQIHEFENFIQFKMYAKKNGLTVPEANMHMMFMGNPGTGKTMIARIMADMLYSAGVIASNKVVEVERKDLVAEYVGQTAVKTGEVINRAMNGVLFIDEAYSLTPKDKNDFGAEAIATLIKAMDDHKDEVVVILAGYSDEMTEFVNSNPGIRSRIGYTFRFKDYETDELVSMFIRKLESGGFTVRAGEKLKSLMEYSKNKTNFGNGRFVDNMIQRAIMKHAGNYSEATAGIIDEDDIPDFP